MQPKSLAWRGLRQIGPGQGGRGEGARGRACNPRMLVVIHV